MKECLNNQAFLYELDKFLNRFDRRSQWTSKITIAVKIPDISIIGFNIISNNYSSYKSSVYYEYFKLDRADLESFRIIGNRLVLYDYAADKNHVFRKNRIITNASPAAFKFLRYGY